MNEVYTDRYMDTDGFIIEDMPVLREESKAWVTIMYGCNNFVSIVLFLMSEEGKATAEDCNSAYGCMITLLGQMQTHGKDPNIGIDFADLLKMVNEIDGIERIRFMTSHLRIPPKS